MPATLRRLCYLLLLFTLPAAVFAEGSASKRFIPVHVKSDGKLAPEQKDFALRKLAEQPGFQHVVVLIHGWDTPTYESTKQYNEVAEQVQQSFQGVGESVAVVGFQWASSAGAARSWMPQALGHYLFSAIGFRNAVRDPYTGKIPRARETGRLALRELLFAIKGQFPAARLHVFAHSMGAEVTAHALDPGFTAIKKGKPEPPVFRPEQPLGLDIVTLAGADLDQDATENRPPDPEESEFRPRLLWITIPKVGDRRDQVLVIRKRARRKRALGDSVPHFRGDQLDTLISQGKLVYDTIDIPSNHKFVKYFGKSRLDRIAAMAGQLRDPQSGKSRLLTKMHAVLSAPAEVNTLSAYLLGDETTPKVYALWRLERLMCGNTQHMSDGYNEKVLVETIRNGFWWDKEREHSPCKVVAAGLWPPVNVVTAAKAAAKKREGREAARRYRHPSLEFYSRPNQTLDVDPGGI